MRDTTTAVMSRAADASVNNARAAVLKDRGIQARDCVNAAAADPTLDFRPFFGIVIAFNAPIDLWGSRESLTLNGVTKDYGLAFTDPLAWKPTLVAHEMGHGFGLDHSFGDDGAEYGDGWDIMSADNVWAFDAPTFGRSGPGMNAFNLLSLGWAPSGRRYTYAFGSGRQRISLAPLSRPSAPGVLTVQIPIDGTSYYTVEYRRGSGWDSGIGMDLVAMHVVRPRPGGGLTSYLLDVNGNVSTGHRNAAWLPGQTFVDWSRALSVTVESFDATLGVASIVINSSDGVTRPLAPTNLRAGTVADGSIQSLWTSDSAFVSHFQVAWKRADAAGWTLPVSGSASLTVNGSCSASPCWGTGNWSTLAPGWSYYVQVRACNGWACSDWTPATVINTTGGAAPAAPSNPRGGFITGTSVQFLWNDTSPNEDRFQIAYGGGTFAANVLTEVSANVTSFTLNGLMPGWSYYFTVRSCRNGYVCSDWLPWIALTTTGGTPPTAPGALRAGTVSDTSIEIRWSDNSTNEERFQIAWGPEGTPSPAVTEVGRDITAFNVTSGLTPGARYSFTVRSCWHGYVCSEWLPWITVTARGATVPSAPRSLSRGIATDTSIGLLWEDTSLDEMGFQVAYAPAGGGWSYVTTGSRTDNPAQYTVTGLSAGTGYWFYVRACNSAGCSGWSNALYATTTSGGRMAPSSGRVASDAARAGDAPARLMKPPTDAPAPTDGDSAHGEGAPSSRRGPVDSALGAGSSAPRNRRPAAIALPATTTILMVTGRTLPPAGPAITGPLPAAPEQK